MSLSRYRNLSLIVGLLVSACGDGDPTHHVVDAPSEVAEPGEDEILQQDDQKVAVEPDAIGLPCDVKEFLMLHCQGCHSADAKNGTPLLTHENLVAAAKKDPALMVGERAILRLLDREKPMPPVAKKDPVSADDLVMLSTWVDADMPAGRCDL